MASRHIHLATTISLLSFCCFSALAAPVQLQLTNPSAASRVDEPVWLALSDLGVNSRHWTVSTPSGQPLPSQLVDRDGNGQPDHLLLVLPRLEGQQTLTLTPSEQAPSSSAQASRAHAEISIKTGGHWQGARYIGGSFQPVKQLTTPAQYTDHSEFIRYEGPGIESDKVAYRIYLDWRNGFDIYGNITGKPILHQVGLDGYESYHNMQSWGLDLLKVGQSLGTGGFGFWDGKQVQSVGDVASHSATILHDGPLYSAFSIDYHGWRLPAKQVRDSKAPNGVRALPAPSQNTPKVQLDVNAQFSMLAGSRLVHTQVKLKPQGKAHQRSPELLPAMAIGLVKHANAELLTGTLESSGHQYTYLATWGKQSLNNDDLGMAVLVKRGAVHQFTADSTSHVAVIKPSGNQFEYYFLAAWSGEPNGITSKADFINYLQQQVQRLTSPARQQLMTEQTKRQTQQPLTAQRALWWSEQMAQTAFAHQANEYYWGGWDTERSKPVTFEYTTGLLLQAMSDLHRIAPKPMYQQAIDKMVDSFVQADGTIHSYDLKKFNIDSINSGNLLLRVYQQRLQSNVGATQRTPAQLQQALAQLRQQLAEHPRTQSGAFWHKQIYPNQVWLDGVYMGMPFLTRYSKLFEADPTASIEQVVHEFAVVQQQLRDAKTGLYFHGWDESKQAPWADKTSGLSPESWSRGMGWLSMALVDVLAELPAADAANQRWRQPLVSMSQQLADSLLKVQDATGMWWNLAGKPGATGNYLESSASAMFVYFLAKGINDGVLPNDARYRDAALRGFQGLLDNAVIIDSQQHMHLVSMIQVAGLSNGRDGSAAYYAAEPVYRNDSKGTAPFIMAGVQLAQLLAR